VWEIGRIYAVWLGRTGYDCEKDVFAGWIKQPEGKIKSPESCRYFLISFRAFSWIDIQFWLSLEVLSVLAKIGILLSRTLPAIWPEQIFCFNFSQFFTLFFVLLLTIRIPEKTLRIIGDFFRPLQCHAASFGWRTNVSGGGYCLPWDLRCCRDDNKMTTGASSSAGWKIPQRHGFFVVDFDYDTWRLLPVLACQAVFRPSIFKHRLFCKARHTCACRKVFIAQTSYLCHRCWLDN